MLGAWAAALDALAEHRGRLTPSMSAAEVVAAAPPALPALPALASLANRARFDHTAPSPQEATAAWAAADAVRTSLRATAGAWPRARAALSPSSAAPDAA